MSGAPSARPASPPPLHEALRPLAFLLGSWRGRGQGAYPGIESFAYEEETRFWHVGRPFLAYAQRTWSLSGAPLHSETGYWRPQGDGTLEVVLAHPFGIVEIEEGRVDGVRIELRATVLAPTRSARRVDSLARALEAVGDDLVYSIDMAAGGHPLQRHLRARLRRAGSGAVSGVGG